ncbi:hypothetical protein TELCIR_09787 [Teladorsagia circumcincta]|uniref:SCP domain-containing protein n=1 Tax=Teladorsagia circumcincta TaxID=45464 RepID=A0A2G9UDX1_TELCI|nr:hypothetical protein TELCIR_09787 [Teladorsagia circumcincta]
MSRIATPGYDKEESNCPRLTNLAFQMAWASTTQVGCGAKLCGDNYIVVCRYTPRGNVVNQNIYNAGPMCSQCFGACSKTYLYKGLCVLPPVIQSK